MLAMNRFLPLLHKPRNLPHCSSYMLALQAYYPSGRTLSHTPNDIIAKLAKRNSYLPALAICISTRILMHYQPYKGISIHLKCTEFELKETILTLAGQSQRLSHKCT